MAHIEGTLIAAREKKGCSVGAKASLGSNAVIIVFDAAYLNANGQL